MSPSEIAAWANRTFGPLEPGRAGALAAIRRADVEFRELVDAVYGIDPDDIAAEMADVMINLYRLAAHIGRPIADAVEAKMQVNLRRWWHRTGPGTGANCRVRNGGARSCRWCDAGDPLVEPEVK